MFDKLTLGHRIMIAAAICVAIGTGILTFKHYYDLAILLEKDNKELKASNKTLNEQLELQAGSHKLDDQGITKSKQETDGVVGAGNKDQKNADAAVTKANEKWDRIDPQKLRQKEREDEASRIRILSLWETYCRQNADNPHCVELAKSNGG